MQQLVRDIVYWQGMDADFADYVKHCKFCITHKATQAIKLMLPRDILEGPSQDLAPDFFHHNNTEYLPIVDTVSKYPYL